MARLETKMDAVLSQDKDKEKRIRSLEKWRWGHSLGALALAAFLTKLGLPMPGEH